MQGKKFYNFDKTNRTWQFQKKMIVTFSFSIGLPKDTLLFFLTEESFSFFIFLFIDGFQGCPNLKDLGIHDGDNLCEGLNIDDVQLNLENDEIFGCFQGATGYQHENGEMDGLVMERNLSVTESNGLLESALEVIPPCFLLVLPLETAYLCKTC